MRKVRTDTSDQPNGQVSQTGAAPEHKTRRKRPRCERPVEIIAHEMGVSLSTFYRLRRRAELKATTASPGNQQMRVSAQILSLLGHAELLGSNAQSYLEIFITSYVRSFSELLQEESTPLDPRWAKGNAVNAVEMVKTAAKRRRDHIDRILANESESDSMNGQ